MTPGLDVVDVSDASLKVPTSTQLPPLSTRVSVLEARVAALELRACPCPVADVHAHGDGVPLCGCDLPEDISPENMPFAAPPPDVDTFLESCLPEPDDLAASLLDPPQRRDGLGPDDLAGHIRHVGALCSHGACGRDAHADRHRLVGVSGRRRGRGPVASSGCDEVSVRRQLDAMDLTMEEREGIIASLRRHHGWK